jgi:universal stress protein A
MKADTILVPVDFSEYQETVLDLAASLASTCKAKLVIVYVADPARTYGETTVYSGIADPQREVMEKMLHEVRPPSPDVPYTHRYRTGVPADAIVDCAKEVKADMIVMGTHGRTGFSRVLMGSVAEAVVRSAPCPVITVKMRPQETEADA